MTDILQHGTDAEDAERWRALVNCERFTVMGSAGLGEKRYDNNYAHVTVNFWTVYPDAQTKPFDAEWFGTFMEIALKEYRRKQENKRA